MPIDKIIYDDNLRQGTDKLNEAIEQANRSEVVRIESEKIMLDSIEVNKDSKIIRDASEKERLETQAVKEATEAVRAATDIVRADVYGVINDLEYTENYSDLTAYKKNNTVTFNGEGYIAKQDVQGIAPTKDPNDDNWGLFAKKGADGTGTVTRGGDTFTSAAGQTVFNLSGTYDQYMNRIDVSVGGVVQTSPTNFLEATNSSIQFKEGLPAGLIVEINYFNEAQPLGTDLEQVVSGLTALTVDTNKTITGVNNLVSEHSETLLLNAAQLAEAKESLNARLDEKIIESGAANAEVTDAHISTIKNKTFTTVRNRFEESESDIQKIKSVVDTSLKNIVVNGDFKNSTGWSAMAGTLSALNNEMIYSVTALSASGRMINTILPKIGHKYYVRGEIFPKYANETYFLLGNVYSQRPFTPVANQWNSIKGILEPTTTANSLRIYHETNVNYAVGDVVKYRNFVMVDLTEFYGANIPDSAIEKLDATPYFELLSMFTTKEVFDDVKKIEAKTEEIDSELKSTTIGKISRINMLEGSLISPMNANALSVADSLDYQKYSREIIQMPFDNLGIINALKLTTTGDTATGNVYLARVQRLDVENFQNKKVTFQFHIKGSVAVPIRIAAYTGGGVRLSPDLIVTTSNNIQRVMVSVNTTTITGFLYFYIFTTNYAVPVGSVFYIGAPSLVNGDYLPTISIHENDSYYTEPFYDKAIHSLSDRVSAIDGGEHIVNETTLVIIDDDGRDETYLWKDIMIEKGVPVTLAPILYKNIDPNYAPTQTFLTPLQMLELQDLGAEFVNHGNKSMFTHTVYDNYALIKQEFVDSVKWHKDNGLNRYNDSAYYFVYGGGLTTGTPEEIEEHKKVISKYFKAGVNAGQQTIVDPNQPFDRYDIPRVTGDGKTATFLNLKLDEAIAVKGMMVVLSHAYTVGTLDAGDPTKFNARYNGLIDYALANGVKVRTLTDALEVRGLV